MRQNLLMTMAAAPTVAIVGNIPTNQLDAPTPCTEYDVRKLINHLLFWGPSLEGAAGKKSVAPPGPSEQEVDLTDGWAAKLEAQNGRLVTAWSRPDAWEGTTWMGGPTPMPASMIGGMIVGELILHTWDLARATGQDPKWDAEVLAFLHQEIQKSAEQGRQMGVYGDEVPVPPTASLLDQTLGLTGRSPNWTAG
jgi:uncharacterized protein (TIGR03086 family)